ncbi:MAG: hypothetical protein HYX72_15025 [Acidobacteria bacterium]|nr:hypothetical protein [Acidobacteriota bacterium]
MLSVKTFMFEPRLMIPRVLYGVLLLICVAGVRSELARDTTESDPSLVPLLVPASALLLIQVIRPVLWLWWIFASVAGVWALLIVKSAHHVPYPLAWLLYEQTEKWVLWFVVAAVLVVHRILANVRD